MLRAGLWLTDETGTLAQRFVWWWSWWCFDIIKIVEPQYTKIPIPEFYVKWNEKLGPKLAELEVDLQKANDAQRNTLGPKLKAVIEQAMR